MILLGANDIYAQCACGSLAGRTAFEQLKRADAVFVGEVIRVERVRINRKVDYEEFDVTFKIKTAWKTDLPETVTIKNTTSPRLTDSDFKEKEIYLVYARYSKTHRNKLSAYIGCCTMTGLLTRVTEHLKEFEKNGEKPRNIIKNQLPDRSKAEQYN